MAIGNPITLTSNVASKTISAVATASQTQFTVTGGYRINQLAVFRNGVRLVDGRDFTATDGSIVTLLSAASLADVLEFQIFDSFNIADAIVSAASTQTISGNLNVTGSLSASTLDTGTGGLNVVGVVTASSFVGSGEGLTGVASTDFIVTGTAATFNNTTELQNVQLVGVTTGLNVSGVATFASNVTAVDGTFSGNVSVAGTLTYEDVTNIDSVGLVTARTGVRVTEGGLVVTAGVSTFSGPISVGDTITLGDHDRLRFGAGNDLQLYHDATNSHISNDSGTFFIDQLVNDGDLNIRCDNGSGGATTYVQCDGSSGAVKIYHYGTLKFETAPTGAVVTGILTATSFVGSGASLTGISSWEVYDTWLYGGG
jgi:hypothetical protein